MDRRTFVGTAGAAATSLALPSVAFPSVTARSVNAPAAQVPSLSPDVFRQRMAKMQQALTASHLDLLVATPSTNFHYLTGYDPGRSERLIALFLPVSGDPVIVCPSFEVDRLTQNTVVKDIRGWKEQDNPYDLVGDVVEPMKPPHRYGQAGLEPTTAYQVSLKLADKMGDWRWTDAGTQFEKLRIIKAPEELIMIRAAVGIMQDAMAATFAQLATGMAERDAAQLLSAEIEKRGSTGGGLVQFGANSALPHSGPGTTRLAREMVVLIDAGCAVNGYRSDITRTIWWGDTPSDEFKKVYDVVFDAQQAALDFGKPFVHCQEMDRTARAVIANAGYSQFFTHRLGHGLGMDGHEVPYLVEGNDTRLESGMVFTLEPGIYQPGKFGVRIEDDCVMTDQGASALSQRATKL